MEGDAGRGQAAMRQGLGCLVDLIGFALLIAGYVSVREDKGVPRAKGRCQRERLAVRTDNFDIVVALDVQVKHLGLHLGTSSR